MSVAFSGWTAVHFAVMETVEKNCPLCDRAPEHSQYELDRDVFAVECAICGRFQDY